MDTSLLITFFNHIYENYFFVSGFFSRIFRGFAVDLLADLPDLLTTCTAGQYYYADPENKCMFYQCDDFGRIFHMTCPPGVIWDQSTLVCSGRLNPGDVCEICKWLASMYVCMCVCVCECVCVCVYV